MKEVLIERNIELNKFEVSVLNENGEVIRKEHYTAEEIEYKYGIDPSVIV